MLLSDKVESRSFDEMTLFYRQFLRLIAILPFDGRDHNYLASRLLLVYCLISSLINWSSFVVYVINGATMPTIDTICETLLVVGLHARYYLLLWRRREFTYLVQECRAIWEIFEDDHRRDVRHFERKVRLLFQWLLGSCVFINLLYSLSAVSLTLNAARNNRSERFLPYKWFAERSEDSWPGYKINFPLQVLLVINGGTIGSTVDSAAPFLIMIGAGYLRALRNRLFQAYSTENQLKADRELVACTQLHQRIIRYCSRIDAITRTMFFVQLICTGYNTSLIGIKLASTDPDKYKYVPLALLNLGQLFICQWAPDHLINESTAISTAAYSVSFPWMKRSMGKTFVLIIARAQRPVRMTAAGIVYLSLENFGAMLKGALSFFTMLRNFNV